MTGRISQIIDSSVVDGPGNRTAIFFQGCNFNCHYCHNPETIAKGSSKQDMELEEVLQRIRKNRPFIKGITVSGGECTLQHEFLSALFKETKIMGLTNFIDTNGSLLLRDLPELLEVTDGVMLDIKATDVTSHIDLTGQDNKNVLENARFLASIGKLYELRTVVVEGDLFNEKTVEGVGDLLAPYIGTSSSGTEERTIRYKIIPFRPYGVREAYRYHKAPDAETMDKLKALALAKGFTEVIVPK